MEQKLRTVPRLECDRSIYFDGDCDVPCICPHCNTPNFPQIRGFASVPIEDEKHATVVVALKCASCLKYYNAVYYHDKSADTLEYRETLPIPSEITEYPELYAISEKFKQYHIEANRAYNRGDRELAIVGFRSAVEFLLKDFAIKEDGENEEDIAKQSLADTIGRYFQVFGKSADIVRVLGNDYTHYKNKHETIPHEIALKYYNIVVEQMKLKYDMKHTPLD